MGLFPRKVGRPSILSLKDQHKEKSKNRPAAPLPTLDVPLDQSGHQSSFDEKDGAKTRAVRECMK
jgi:hypothetical protein